jgi:inner membrane protein
VTLPTALCEHRCVPTVFTHAVLAASAFTLVARGRRGARRGAIVAALVSAAPDADVLWWGLTSYGEPWGHRGMTHSLAAAVVLSAVAVLCLRRRVDFPGGAWAMFALIAGVTCTHGVFDAMTDGGHGVGFFLPFEDARYFLPVRPVPAAPISVNPFRSRLWFVLALELLLFWPFAALLFWARVEMGVRRAVTLVVGLLVSAVTWGIRIADQS